MQVQRPARLLFVAACMSLTGCAVHLESDYDDQIDSSLTSANTDITSFVDKMISVAGTPAGTYDQNKDFYILESAKLSTIRVRAEAHRALHSCPTTEVVSHALLSNAPKPSFDGPTATPPVQDVISHLPKDDCEVVLISLIQSSFANLKNFHSSQREKGIPSWTRDPILTGGLGSLLRSAIQVQVALKSDSNSGGK